MSTYADALAAAERQGLAAHDAIEAWLSRPADAPEIPGAILEGYAADLRESRERIRALFAEHGNRDDIVEGLAMNEAYHRALGLSVRDKPEFDDVSE